jgi:hypothetical protein
MRWDQHGFCRARRLRAVVGIPILLAACTSHSDPSPSNPQASENAIADQANVADINSTKLPDANFDDADQLARRKRGLALSSAESADPTKAGTIEPGAVDPYDRANYPEVVRRWGSLVPVINRERSVAAKIAARDARCDGVVNVQITDHGARNDRHYMVECNNLTRVYFDGKSLKAQTSALVRTQADMGAQGVLDW